MRFNPINSVIAVLLSALLAYGLWSLDGSLKNYVAIGGFAYFAGTLVPCLGASFEYTRRGTNLRILSGLFFAVGLAINGLFALMSMAATTYVILLAIVFLMYAFAGNMVLSRSPD